MNSFWGKEQVAIFAPWKDFSQDLGHLNLNHLLNTFVVVFLAFACNATFRCLGGIFFHCLGNHSLPLFLRFKPLKPSLHVVQGPGKRYKKLIKVLMCQTSFQIYVRKLYMGEVIVCTCRRCELSETRQTWKAPRRRRTWDMLAKILRLAFSGFFCNHSKCKSFQLSSVHSFLASTNAAALFSSVQFYQVLVFSCRPNRSWFHLPAKKMMILVTIFPVGNWWLTTWEYLQNSNNPTVQLIIENSSAAPRAKKNGRNLSNDTSLPHFKMLFVCPKMLHYCFIIYKCMTFWVNFPPPVEAEDSLPRNGFNDPMDKRLLGRFLHIFSKNPHDANLTSESSARKSSIQFMVKKICWCSRMPSSTRGTPTTTRDRTNHSFKSFHRNENSSSVSLVLLFYIFFPGKENYRNCYTYVLFQNANTPRMRTPTKKCLLQISQSI